MNIEEGGTMNTLSPLRKKQEDLFQTLVNSNTKLRNSNAKSGSNTKNNSNVKSNSKQR